MHILMELYLIRWRETTNITNELHDIHDILEVLGETTTKKKQ